MIDRLAEGAGEDAGEEHGAVPSPMLWTLTLPSIMPAMHTRAITPIA